MTSRPSSTSASDGRGLHGFRGSPSRYLGRLVTMTLAGCVLLGSIGYAALAHGLVTFPNQSLLRRQVAKIERPDFAASIVFVGDSSLGNGIDAALFSELSGHEAANLALTGSFGYAGSANLLERAARRGTVRTAIIVQTTDMLTREPDPLSEIQTKPAKNLTWRDRLKAAQLYFSWPTIATVAERILDEDEQGKEGEDDAATGDYVAQDIDAAALARDLAGNLEDLPTAEEISPRARRELEELVDVCRRFGVHCLYAHGPLMKVMCERTKAFRAVADRVIAETGIDVVPGTPVCFPRSEMGDTVDHVADDEIAASTHAYYERLAPYL